MADSVSSRRGSMQERPLLDMVVVTPDYIERKVQAAATPVANQSPGRVDPRIEPGIHFRGDELVIRGLHDVAKPEEEGRSPDDLRDINLGTPRKLSDGLKGDANRKAEADRKAEDQAPQVKAKEPQKTTGKKFSIHPSTAKKIGIVGLGILFIGGIIATGLAMNGNFGANFLSNQQVMGAPFLAVGAIGLGGCWYSYKKHTTPSSNPRKPKLSNFSGNFKV